MTVEHAWHLSKNKQSLLQSTDRETERYVRTLKFMGVLERALAVKASAAERHCLAHSTPDSARRRRGAQVFDMVFRKKIILHFSASRCILTGNCYMCFGGVSFAKWDHLSSTELSPKSLNYSCLMCTLLSIREQKVHFNVGTFWHLWELTFYRSTSSENR